MECQQSPLMLTRQRLFLTGTDLAVITEGILVSGSNADVNLSMIRREIFFHSYIELFCSYSLKELTTISIY